MVHCVKMVQKCKYVFKLTSTLPGTIPTHNGDKKKDITWMDTLFSFPETITTLTP